eukprot:12267-Heterococcus_DN1.PRE.3
MDLHSSVHMCTACSKGAHTSARSSQATTTHTSSALLSYMQLQVTHLSCDISRGHAVHAQAVEAAVAPIHISARASNSTPWQAVAVQAHSSASLADRKQ